MPIWSAFSGWPADRSFDRKASVGGRGRRQRSGTPAGVALVGRARVARLGRPRRSARRAPWVRGPSAGPCPAARRTRTRRRLRGFVSRRPSAYGSGGGVAQKGSSLSFDRGRSPRRMPPMGDVLDSVTRVVDLHACRHRRPVVSITRPPCLADIFPSLALAGRMLPSGSARTGAPPAAGGRRAATRGNDAIDPSPSLPRRERGRVRGCHGGRCVTR
jgi:hypothetical protein